MNYIIQLPPISPDLGFNQQKGLAQKRWKDNFATEANGNLKSFFKEIYE